MEYEVGDIVKLKKQHPCGSRGVGNPPRGCRLPPEMHGLRPSGHDAAPPGGKKYERAEKRSGREEELSYYAGILQLFYEMLPGSEQNKKSGKQEKKACLSTFFMV